MIPALVLAAGRSSRMGRAKATLPVDDHDTFLSRIVRTFVTAGIDDVVVVLGHDASVVAESLTDSLLPARFALNREYDRGQLSSIRTGLAVIDRPGVTAVLLTLVDVPLFSSSTVRAIVARFRESGAPVVRPVSNGRHGHPILLARSLFDLVRSTGDEAGLKPIVRGYASAAGDVEVVDEGAFVDIDTVEEYRRVIGLSLADARGLNS
ncbi:MAG TPA: nucleotidyltransferase family protein [Vicinamibacterales bacterium]